MSFVDSVTLQIRAGRGGDGKLSFRHEKFIRKGGPDGGNGGNGGNVVLKASRNQNTLAAFRYQKELKADDGQAGGKARKHGKRGSDRIVLVPIGTVATRLDNAQIIADLTIDEATTVIASGGRGGYGNAHFISSRRQAPNFAEKGEPGENVEVRLEIKMVADVGLIGLPNAGKSTLLSRISHAQPEIADYPFTTLTPNLGVVDIDTNSMLVADIPGLIAGAAKGKGLGHDFLRHIERTAVTLHLIDAYHKNVAEAYRTVKEELKAYQPTLIKHPEVVALNKVEGLDEEIIADLVRQLEQATPKGTPIVPISAQSGYGVQPLIYLLKDKVTKTRAKKPRSVSKPPVPVIRLDDTSRAFSVKKSSGSFLVSGERIEHFARRTDFANPEAVQRLRNVMRRDGIRHELIRKGIKSGQNVYFGDNKDDFLEY